MRRWCDTCKTIIQEGPEPHQHPSKRAGASEPTYHDQIEYIRKALGTGPLSPRAIERLASSVGMPRTFFALNRMLRTGVVEVTEDFRITLIR